MSYMIEVYYRVPEDKAREGRLAECASAHGGWLDYPESADRVGGPVCLTFDFPTVEQAQAAADRLRSHGEHIDGPMDYGE